MTTKAVDIMKKSVSASEKAEKYGKRIKRNLKIAILDAMNIQKEQIEDKIDNLQEFSLDTDLNRGQRPVTAEECEKRFAEIILLRRNLKLLELEIKETTKIFNEYFGKWTEKDETTTEE